nr:acetate kinase [bacterium]
MKILVINAGSSSIKYQLFDMEDESVLAKGAVERIGIQGSNLVHKVPGRDNYTVQADMKDHIVAMQAILGALTDPEHGVVSSMDEISAVGHRVVQGGSYFDGPALCTEDTLNKIRDLCDLAPLHNPAHLMGMEACRNVMPNTPMVAVFDTAFHQTMPPTAYLYPLPYEYYEKYHVRRYGAHGTSHKYVSRRAAELMGRPVESLKTVTCHLGNGASITAVDGGKSVDTSMGLTPLAGIMMGTRSGDIDPAIMEYMMEKTGMSIKEMTRVLNKESGLLGISGISSDMRDCTAAREENPRAELAIDMFCYRVRRFIGAYAALMGGLDAVVFTAGIGENTPYIRKRCCEGLAFMGVEIDDAKNNRPAGDFICSPDGAKVTVMTIATDEEKVIARETRALLENP